MASAENRGKRVLQVVAGLDRGGIEVWLSQVTPHLVRSGYKVDFLAYRPGKYSLRDSLEAIGCQVYTTSLQHTPPGIWRFIRVFRKLLKENRYDVIHCHGALLTGAFARFAAFHGAPVRIVHSHGSGDNSADKKRNVRRLTSFGESLSRRWIRIFATDKVACSKEAAAYLFGNQWRNENATVLHCGINVTPFSSAPNRSETRRKLGVADGALVVGIVGNLRFVKNHSFFLQIAKSVLVREPSAEFFVIGEGEKRYELEREAAEMGIAAKIRFLGPRADVPALMIGLLDVMVLPSFCEGLGIVLLESQVAGLPAVASDRVPSEVAFVPDLITFLPLEHGPDVWGSTILDLRSRRGDPVVGTEEIKKTDFWIERSADKLAAFYEAAIARAGKRGRGKQVADMSELPIRTTA